MKINGRLKRKGVDAFFVFETYFKAFNFLLKNYYVVSSVFEVHLNDFI
jgi:hypothetical protein